MSFLPTHFSPNLFVIFGLLVLIGVVGAILAHKTRFIPRITALMAVGFAFGPEGFGWLSHEMLDSARVFIDITLGIIMFNLGRRLNFQEIRGMKGLYPAALLDIGLTFTILAGGLVLFGAHWLSALIMAAIGVSASPAIAMMVVQEFGATGPVATRSLPMIALNNLASFVLFTVLIPLVYFLHGQDSLLAMFLHPLYLLVGSFALAYLLYSLANLLAQKHLVEADQTSFPLLIGLLAFGIGFSQLFELSGLLTNLLLGMMIANLRHVKRLTDTPFGGQEEIFLMILFVVAGARLHLHDVLTYAPWVALFVALRLAGRLLASVLAYRFTNTTLQQNVGIAGMLTPMAGLAIGLIQMTESLAPSLGRELAALILASVAVLETFGPPLCEWALKWNHELSPDDTASH